MDFLLQFLIFGSRVLNGKRDVRLFDEEMAETVLNLISDNPALDVLLAGYFDIENRVNSKESLSERRAEIDQVFEEILGYNPISKIEDERAKKVLRIAIYELLVSYRLSAEDVATFAENLSLRFGLRVLLALSNYAQGLIHYDETAVFGYEFHRESGRKGTISTSSTAFRLAVYALVGESEFESVLNTGFPD